MSTLTPHTPAPTTQSPVHDIPLPAPPPPSLRSQVARTGLRAAIPRFRGDLRVVLPDGELLFSRDASDEPPTMTIASEDAFTRSARDGKVGLGEAYMARDWDADDLAAVLAVWADNLGRLPIWVQRLAHLSPRGQQRAADENSTAGSARNIRAHYDLGNELFALFLDRSMTYSCAVFAPGDTLEDAQARKRDLLLDDLDLHPEAHLLEIGTGWGALAVHAARRHGCRVTTVTLSHEQAEHARRLVAQEGLAHLVDVRLADYRELVGQFDAIISVEMLEAVGEAYWDGFFTTLASLLAPAGRIALQTITFDHDRFRVARGGYGWIHKYIFPGGEIPSLEALRAPITQAGLTTTSTRHIGQHYPRTLATWRQRFEASREHVHALGYGPRFVRMWEYYLAYSEAGFTSGTLDDAHLVLARPVRT